MSVWKQIDELKSKFTKDMANAKASAEAFKFVAVTALPHGEWTARSAKSAKHSANIRARNADELVAQMKAAFEAAEKRGVKLAP